MPDEEPEAKRDIHEIRAKFQEEIKHMTPEEQTEYINRKAKEAIKKSGLAKIFRPLR